MRQIVKLSSIVLLAAMMTACKVETTDSRVLRVSFTSSEPTGWSWLASADMLLGYRYYSYSHNYLLGVHYDYWGYEYASVADISWLLWHVAGVDSEITGSLTFYEIRQNINFGRPILLQYGDYYFGEYVVLHGYDDDGYVYLHEPHYGTSVIHYDDLFIRYFGGNANYWTSSLILLN